MQLLASLYDTQELPGVIPCFEETPTGKEEHGRVNNIGDAVVLQYSPEVEVHHDWPYKDLDMESSGQLSDRRARLPERICNMKDNKSYMERVAKGKGKEIHSECRKKHNGLTCMSGTVAVGKKQLHCNSMLYDTGCDFNIVSTWFARQLLGQDWENQIRPLAGSTITARMSTGHATKAVGTLVLDVTFAVATSHDTHTVMAYVDNLYHPPDQTDNS